MLDINKLREEFSTVKAAADSLFSKLQTENRDYTEDERKEQDKRFARLEQIKNLIDEQAKFAALALSNGAPEVTVPVTLPGKEEFKAAEEGKEPMNFAKMTPENKAKFTKAINAWASSGEMAKQFATITSATSSSALLPKSVAMPIIPSSANVFREAYSIYGLTPIETGTTEDMSLPVIDASAGGAVAENASSETENEPSLGESMNLNVATYQSGTTYLSNKVVHANGTFDLVANVVPQLTYSKELGLERAIIAAVESDVGITQIVDLTSETISYAKLVDLNRALPKKYDKMKVIILETDTYAAAEKLVGTDGHPILTRDPQNQELLRFNGTPVLRSDEFTGEYGDSDGTVVGFVMSMLGFRLRDVSVEHLHRYDQVPAKPNQTGFNLCAYHGFDWAPSAVATLKL